jgi:hypothetical protein
VKLVYFILFINCYTYCYRCLIVKLIVTDVSFKRRWVNVRDQFNKSLNRRKTKSGQAADSNVKRYKYEEVLQFVMPHIHERSTISSIEQPTENDSDVVNSQAMASADDEMCEEISASKRNADIHQPETPRKKRKIVLPETASSALMKYIIENNKKQNHYKHPIDAFLEGLAPTLKTLPPYYQHLAKGKIFSVVQDLEGQALFGSPATPHSSRDSWDDLPLTLRTLQPMDNSSSAMDIADVNITGLTPQQPSTLAP